MVSIPLEVVFISGISSILTPAGFLFLLVLVAASGFVIYKKAIPLKWVPLGIAGLFFLYRLIVPFDSIGAVEGAIITSGDASLSFIHTLGWMVIPVIISIIPLFLMKKK